MGDGKAFRSGSGGRKSTMTTVRQQVDLFLCRKSCNGSTTKGTAAEGGGTGQGNERVASTFGGRLGKVG